MKCGFKWVAPFLVPPDGKKVKGVEQECCLEEGHEGLHRSLTKVIHKPGLVWWNVSK